MERWFLELKACLQEYYHPNRPDDIVGYLRGSKSPAVWRQMAEAASGQMIILGNEEPSRRDWDAAGVGHRFGETHAITLDDLKGFIVLYGGFVYRPWGHIVPRSDDAVNIGFPGSLRSWERNRPGT